MQLATQWLNLRTLLLVASTAAANDIGSVVVGTFVSHGMRMTMGHG